MKQLSKEAVTILRQISHPKILLFDIFRTHIKIYGTAKLNLKVNNKSCQEVQAKHSKAAISS